MGEKKEREREGKRKMGDGRDKGEISGQRKVGEIRREMARYKKRDGIPGEGCERGRDKDRERQEK